MKRILVLLALLCFTVGMSGFDVKAEESIIEESQEAAYNAYLNLSENLGIRMDMISADYPDTFGGCYLDNNNLVILLTDVSECTKEFYLEACECSEGIIFEKVPYSYEYLLEIEKDAVPEMESITEVYEHYVDVTNNTVKVGVDESYNAMTTYSAAETSPVSIYKMESIPQATAMRGGEELVNDTTPCSICFFGKYNGKDTLITCGHSNPLGTNIYYNGTKIGSVIKQNLRIYKEYDDVWTSYGDFSIVDISNSSVAGSNYVKTPSGNITATGTANLVVGLTVKLYGKDTGCVIGTVKNTSVTAEFYEPNDYEKPYRVKGLVTIDSTSFVDEGDSGGCAIYTTSAGVNRIAGCITGKKDGVYSYITPSSYIESSGFSFN